MAEVKKILVLKIDAELHIDLEEGETEEMFQEMQLDELTSLANYSYWVIEKSAIHTIENGMNGG